MSYFASENAHKTLKDCDKGDVVNIRHTPREAGGTMYLVDVVGKANLKTKNKSSDTDLAIKWGMAFNNATRLVGSTLVEDKLDDVVKEVERIMPAMFKIACSMPTKIEEDDKLF